MKRRDAIKGLSLSAALGAYGYLGQHETEAQSVASNDRGESPIRITKVKPILTAPSRLDFVSSRLKRQSRVCMA